ncbi:Er lumen protein retaining receptor family protein [Thalictrum thalictroides]|uniref:Er lumen protein retaining receptor family protein n=1 Tax=Thalictrum thalictroides TaxID=46969 RepID=A0A7J6WGK0_THATH|nr:Er lumen protein retaining receptor family protein [Thalictrum thalictroides]
MGRRRNSAVNVVFEWFQKQTLKVKILLGFLFGIVLLGVLRLFIRNHYELFVVAESIHAVGILALIYKLITKKNCSGLSLKSQEITAIFLGVIPAAVLATFVHPSFRWFAIDSILWAFCVYLESVSVLPQLRLMQNAKMAEPFTALYVFALGVARFFSCAYWITMIIETRGQYLHFWGFGRLWMLMNLIAEFVQTFILADFCYYYAKRVTAGQLSVLPLPV